MAAGGGADLADGVHTDVHRRIIAQGHFRVGQVVIDGSGNADAGHAEIAQGLGAAETAVSADDHQAVDLHALQGFDGFLLKLLFLELQAAGRAQIGARLVRDIQHQFQRQLLHVVLQVGAFTEQAVVTALYADQRNAVHRRAARDAHHGRVHARAVPAGSKYADLSHG